MKKKITMILLLIIVIISSNIVNTLAATKSELKDKQSQKIIKYKIQNKKYRK